MTRMQGGTGSRHVEHFAGTDLRKAHPDLALWPEEAGARTGKTTARAMGFDTTGAGIAALAARRAGPHLGVTEPTGRSHDAACGGLAAAGLLRRAMAWPRSTHLYRARGLAEGRGQRARTAGIDAGIDAGIMARIAAHDRPLSRPAPRDIS